jgi:phenylalanyl-tRNA synthetase beta chain
MLQLTGATLADGTIDVGPFAQRPWSTPTIILRDSKVQRLLGMTIARERQRELLTALGFGIPEEDRLAMTVRVPPFRRNDVTREADLVEEVGRFDLDRLPATLPKRRGAAGRLSSAQRLRRRAIDALVGRGAYEVVGWSFTDPAVADRLRLPADDPRRRFVALENPMSEDHAVLRTTLLGSLLDAARHNTARGNADLRLFEQGAVYHPRDNEQLPHEHRSLAGLLHGRLTPPSWRTADSARADFFAAKGLLGAMLDVLRVPWSVEAAPEPFLHPGRSAEVWVGDGVVGWVGELHPLVARTWDLEDVAVFEVDLDRVVAAADQVPYYVDLTSFPPVRQDLAVVVADDVAASDLVSAARGAALESGLLHGVDVVDVYRGAQVGEGRKSLLLALTFQAPDRTLTDEDVAPVREQIVAALAGEGGELRG